MWGHEDQSNHGQTGDTVDLDQDSLEDFGAPRLAESAINALLERARMMEDIDLRRLVKEVQVWRRVAPLLLDRLAPPGSPLDESDALLMYARFLVRGEGAIGARSHDMAAEDSARRWNSSKYFNLRAARDRQ